MALAVAAAALAAARHAAAQPAAPAPAGGHVYLSWVRLAGADSCPDVRQIADDVTRRLGWNPFRETPTQFIEAQIRRDAHPPPPAERPSDRPAGTWVAEIFLRDSGGASRGNRIFTSNAPTCASLASVVSLSIAIIIDPDVMIRHFSEEDFWPEGSDRPAAASAPPAPARAGARGVLVLLGGAGVRLLPRLAPGMGLGGEVQVARRVSVRAGGVILPEVRTPTPDDNFAFGLTAGWLGACLDALQRELVALGACAGGMGGIMHVVVYFPDATHPGERAFWAATAGLRLAVHLPARIEIEMGADGVAPLDRRAFTVLGRPPGSDVAFTQPATAALLWGAVGVRFQ
jgi:hypothetical protein